MILLKIYITGVIAGLLFPLIDTFLDTYSKQYRDVSNDYTSDYINIYRSGPVHYKFIAAFFPVINLIWVFTLMIIVRFFYLSWYRNQKIKLIKRLANNPRKHFLFKHWIVKHIFPNYLQFFYGWVESWIDNNEKDYKTLLGLINVINKLAEEKKEEKTGSDEPIN
jgi:hypothetical protein